MSNLTEQKQKANGLRKAGNFKEALLLYRNLWKETGDRFDGAGLLHCLRKVELFDEAIVLADELIVKYPDFEWCRNEAIWTYIQGILDKFNEEEPFERVVEIANRIMNLNPTGLAAKLTVFKVLKSAKSSNHWEAVNERKFFLRLNALAKHLLGNLPESERIYQNLSRDYKPGWWMLHEYAKVVRDIGRREDALRIMYQAASGHSKLESMVSLFVDIGILCKELGKYEEARDHLVLCKYVRNEKGWTVPEPIINTVDDLNKIIGNNKEPSSVKEALSICRTEWSELLGKEDALKNLSYKSRKVKKGLVGKVSLGRGDRPFCFIIANDEPAFMQA